jgi:hypothetical protein
VLDLPNLTPDAALAATVLAVLITAVVAGRAVLAWLALGRMTASSDALVERLDSGRTALAERASHVRTGLATTNAAAERALWRLPQIDRRSLSAERRLSQIRAGIDDWRGPDDGGVRQTLGAFRVTLGMIKAANTFRRAINR